MTVDTAGLLPPATYLGQLQCRTLLAPCTGQRQHRNFLLLLSDGEEMGGRSSPGRKCWAGHSGGGLPAPGLPTGPCPRGLLASVLGLSLGPRDTLQPQAQLVACSEAVWPSAHRPRTLLAAAMGSPRVPAPSIRGPRGSPVGGGWGFDATYRASRRSPSKSPTLTSYCC